MFAIPFGRIFWKEYRSNRALWLACLLIGVVLQIWFLVLSGTLDTQIDHQMRQSTIIGIAFLIPLLYTAGCSAIMFAAERENSTASWLLTISAPPLPTLAGKFSFAILSTIGLQLILAMSACVFLIGEKTDNLHDVLMPIGLAALIWAMLGSLTSRHVLVSVFAMVCWFFGPLVICNLILNVYPRSATVDRIAEMNLWILGSLAFCADLWLGWLWCHGQYRDGTLLERAQQWLNNAFGTLIRREAVSSRIPVRVEPEQSWRRAWQRLFWQERHGERRAYFLMGLGGSFAVLIWLLSQIYGPFARGIPHPSQIWVWSIVISAFYALMMGVVSFQVDYQNQQSRFVANRGIAPGAMWLVKQAVWLPRACILPVAIGAMVFIYYCMAYRPPSSIIKSALFQAIYGSQTGGNEFQFTAGRFCGYVLLGYASGQLASLLFRRSVLAIASSSLLLSALVSWTVVVDYLHLTSWWSFGLPVAMLLAISLWQVRPWLLEVDSWRRRCQVAMALIAVPCVLIGAVYLARIVEVAVAPRDYPWQAVQIESEVSRNANWTADNHVTEATRTRLEILSRPGDDQIQQRAAEIVSLIQQNQTAVIWTKVPELTDSRYTIESWVPNRLKRVLKTAADQHLASKELEQAFDCHLATLQLGRIIGQFGRQNWSIGMEFQYSAFEDLVDWSNHPAQVPDQLQSAIKRVTEEVTRYPRYSHSIIRSYLHDRDAMTYDSADQILDRMGDSNSQGVVLRFLTKLLLLNPAERLRIRMLLARQVELELNEIWHTEQTFAGQSRLYVERALMEVADLNKTYQSFRMTTPILRATSFDGASASDLVKTHHSMARAALIRMELVAYRLESGKLPDQLVDLIPHLDPNLLIDPWSGQRFEFYPAFVFTGGPARATLVFQSSHSTRLFSSGNSLYATNVSRFYQFSDNRRVAELLFMVDGSNSELSEQTIAIRRNAGYGLSLFPIPTLQGTEPAN